MGFHRFISGIQFSFSRLFLPFTRRTFSQSAPVYGIAILLASSWLLAAMSPAQSQGTRANLPPYPALSSLQETTPTVSPEELSAARRVVAEKEVFIASIFKDFNWKAVEPGTPLNTPSPTPTLTLTSDPTATPTPTDTSTPTATYTSTPTPTPTYTPTPTATPTTRAGCPDGTISCWKFDETSGSVFHDEAGQNNASCSGDSCPAFSSGITRGGLSFDGSSDQVKVANHPTLNWGPWNSFSMEIWVKTGASCTGNKVFMGKPPDEDNVSSWWLGCVDGSNTAGFFLRDSHNNRVTLQGTRVINNNRWHHLVAVNNAAQNRVYLYVDGKLESQAEIDYTGYFNSSRSLSFGAYNSSYFLSGRLDQAAVYLRALTSDQVETHYFVGRPPCELCSGAITVMPLGDSITQGTGSINFNGYRRPLYRDLTGMGFDLNFVGSLENGDYDFDRDHEGHGGWHAAGLANKSILPLVYTWLVQNPAEIVLLHIGTNDINDGGQSAAEVSAILDEIDRFSENTTVILARIVNRQVYSAATTQYNLDLQAMADARIARGDKIIVVDMEYALTYPNDMYDLLHPNDSGYAKMSAVWKAALLRFLPDCP